MIRARRHRPIALALTLTALVAAAGCGDGDAGTCNGSAKGGGFLEGSFCSIEELTWDEVRIELQNGTDFVVEYVRPTEAGAAKPLSLFADVGRLVLPSQNQRIEFITDLSGQVRQVLPSGNQTLTSMLDPALSTLLFTSSFNGEVGAPVSGEFSLFFSTTGRTLRGTFDGTLVDPTDEL